MLNFKSVNRDKVKNYTYEMLPKGAYIIKIIDVKTEANKGGNGQHLKIAFDIAEGEYKDFYKRQFDNNPNEDKKWSFDAVYLLSVPDDSSPDWMAQQFFTFLANVEDSNKGYTFNGDETKLKGKLIGGLFRNEQTEDNNGNVYDHTRLRWTRPADDVRNNKFGKLPKDKLIDGTKKNTMSSGDERFMSIPDNAEEDSVPF